MPGLYQHTTRGPGTVLTDSIYNGDHLNHVTNQVLEMTDDFSASVAQMRTVVDPGEVGSESLPTDASGELVRVRFKIKELADLLQGSPVAQWYSTPSVGGVLELDENQNTRNLILNGDQEDWRNGTSVAAFGFTLVGAGAVVARDATNVKTGTYAASVTRAGTDCQYERDCIAEAGGQAYIRGRVYTFGAWVRATVPSRVRIRLNDGVGSTFSNTYHSGGGAYEYMSVTRTLDPLATALKVGLQIDGGDTSGQIDSLMVVEGDRKVAFSLRGETSVFRQVFTASGTYTKPSNLVAARVVVVGGGGAGGAGLNAAEGASGGGGGSGSYSESLLLASAIAATEAVTVAAAGGTSSFGTLVTANGGANGGAGADAVPGAGGAGGTPGTGQVAIAGSDGNVGESSSGGHNIPGGSGGPSVLAGRGKAGAGTGAGAAGKVNSGSGGGGGGARTGTGAGAGGAGATGLVIAWETLVL